MATSISMRAPLLLALAFLLLCLAHTTQAFLLPSALPSSSCRRRSGASVQPLAVKRAGRRSGGSGGSSSGGGNGFGRRGKDDGAEASKDPEKRLANLNRKLTSILELEEVPFEDLNEDQRRKVERKEDVLEEISRLTKRVRKEDFIEEAAQERAGASSAEDLNDDVVGGKIPRTILKLLVYCRLSDRATCEILLELGKVKVNGVVCDDPVALVDLVKDTIEFDGEPVTLPETRLKHKLRSMAAQGEAEDRAESGVPKDYCARIDGGLLIDLTRNIQKSRGDYVDKSPYILRDAQRKGGSFGSGGGGGNHRGGGR